MPAAPPQEPPEPPIPTIEEAEKALIRRALAKYNTKGAAAHLGISYYALCRKIRRWGLRGGVKAETAA